MRCTLPACDCRGWCGAALARKAARHIWPPDVGREPEPMPGPARLSSSLVRAIGKPCPYCGLAMERGYNQRAPTRDHVLPRSRGGSFLDPRNRLIVCRRCNGDKDNMTLVEFACWLAARGDPRAVRVKALAIELTLARIEVLASEECHGLG